MPPLRTSLVVLALGGATVSTGVVAASATASPAPVTAVTVADAGASTGGDGDGDGDGRSVPVRAGVRHWWGSLTDDQRRCLDDADLRRPAWPLDDDERTEVRAQVEAAAEGCGVELPFAAARTFWEGLTDTQRQCLEDAGPTRPLGPMTREERGQVREERRAAAERCGVTLPVREPATSS